MDITVAIALDLYFKDHVSRKVVARKRFEFAQDALNRHLSDELLRDIDIPACRDYLIAREAEGVVESTVRRELGVLQAAARHALKWRRIKADDLPSIELPPDSDPKRVWLFKEELNRLLEVAAEADRRVFRFVQLAYHTASRKRAVEMLTWDRVDLAARRIDLQDASMFRTKKRRPIVPISEPMTAELAALKVKAASNFVLVSDADIRPAFDRVTKKAGLDFLAKSGLRCAGNLTPHVLRHSRATHLLQDNKAPWAVANLLGDSLATVLRVYGHACPEYLAETLS